MTEAEWLTCADPVPMLEFLVGKGPKRKFRLFACACCRRVWHLLNAGGQAVLVHAERRADLPQDDADWQRNVAEFREARTADTRTENSWRLGPASLYHLAERLDPAGYSAVNAIGRLDQAGWQWDWAPALVGEVVLALGFAHAYDRGTDDAWKRGRFAVAAAERAVLAGLVRDLFGNPFCPVEMDPAWLAWDGGTVARLARGIQADRCYEEMPILGDALEDAGCSDAELLGHCRQSGEHTHGCWVLELLLGRATPEAVT